MGSFFRNRWGERQDDKRVRDSELRPWVSPSDELNAGAAHVASGGDCWSQQSPSLRCLPSVLKECAGWGTQKIDQPASHHMGRDSGKEMCWASRGLMGAV